MEMCCVVVFCILLLSCSACTLAALECHSVPVVKKKKKRPNVQASFSPSCSWFVLFLLLAALCCADILSFPWFHNVHASPSLRAHPSSVFFVQRCCRPRYKCSAVLGHPGYITPSDCPSAGLPRSAGTPGGGFLFFFLCTRKSVGADWWRQFLFAQCASTLIWRAGLKCLDCVPLTFAAVIIIVKQDNS